MDWYQNEWHWPLFTIRYDTIGEFRGRIKIMPSIALHSTLNILETVRDRGLVPRDHQWEMPWPMGYQMVTWPMTSRDHERSNSWPNTLRAQYLENSWRCYLATIANYYLVCCEAVSTVGYLSDSLASCLQLLLIHVQRYLPNFMKTVWDISR